MRALAVTLLAALAVFSWAQADAAKARKLLERGMGRQPVVDVRAIIVQRFGYDSGVMQQIKVEMSRGGKLHQLVLAPLSVQGIELVDDGQSSRTYTPDQKLLIIQPSARQDADDVKFRMALVDRNYTLRIDRKEKIAGRSAVVVEAMPRNDELEKRCYAIDEKTGFLLRLETCKDNERPIVHFETKMVEFPTDLPEGTFRLQASLGTNTKRFDRKCLSPKSTNLRSEVGFQPIIPGTLPFGFAIQELQTETDSSLPAVSLRLTDGLAKATVFQWPRRGMRRSQAPEGTLVSDAAGITLMISGDLPDDVKDRILRSFVKAGRSGQALNIPALALSWAQELGCSLNVFPLDRDPEAVAPVLFAIPLLVRI